jgi:Fic family protein
MLLLKKGYVYAPYSSLESIIEAGKEGYYRALRRTQKNIWSGKVDYEPWLTFFLTALQKQKKHLTEKITLLKPINTKLSRTARAILALFDGQAEWTASEVAAKLKLNRETIKKNLKALVDSNYIIKNGGTKGAWYERIILFS